MSSLPKTYSFWDVKFQFQCLVYFFSGRWHILCYHHFCVQFSVLVSCFTNVPNILSLYMHFVIVPVVSHTIIMYPRLCNKPFSTYMLCARVHQSHIDVSFLSKTWKRDKRIFHFTKLRQVRQLSIKNYSYYD